MTPPPQTRLRVIGRNEFLIEPIRAAARHDLGFEIEFELVEALEGLRRVVTAPESFDVYLQWHTVDLIWTAGAIRAIDLDRIDCRAHIFAQAAPPLNRQFPPTLGRKLFVQSDGELGPKPTSKVSVLPLLHGVDSFGFVQAARQLIGPGAENRESWGWLLDARLRGRVGMIADPAIGMLEAALAIEATEGIRFDDIGNLSIEEIDIVAEVLIRLKKLDHFRGFWTSTEECARLMQRGAVVQSMFSPAMNHLRRNGTPVIMADPVEGGRGWHSDLCISSATEGHALDAAYAYLNWCCGSWPAACALRQGLYPFLTESARSEAAPEEWDYWFRGLPAARSLPDPTGRPTIPAGHVREGGSYHKRMSSVRVWNTIMDNHGYLSRRWQEFTNT